MTQAKLTQLKLVNEYGDVLPQAQVLFIDVCLNKSDGIMATKEGEDYESYSSLGGGCYKVLYYGNPLAKAQNYMPRELRTFIDGEFSSILDIDDKNPEIEVILNNSTLNDIDKKLRVAESDFKRRFR